MPLLLHEHGFLICAGCGHVYPNENDIWQFLLPEQQARYQPFLDAYQQIRKGDGWDRHDDTYYINLPTVAADDPHASIWRIRRRTFNILKEYLTPEPLAWALDLGAGNCWLSRYLAASGYNVLALDVNIEGQDALSGGSIYLESGLCSFLRGQACMECLPVQDTSVALCVISGAFHYANIRATLESVFAALKPGGHLVIMDSPVYRDKTSGKQMMAEQHARFKAQYGFDNVPVAGTGYLVLEDMISALSQANFRTVICWPERPGSRFVRKLFRPTTKGREEARFPLFICTKAS